ncbi:hypothetical protein N9N75_01140 [Candidatus Pelagibacter sp.]|nr:hypothetical protein [Candidatus Pelagibacter sp.]
MKKKISVIITLFRTPLKKIKNLYQYKNFNVLIFEQEKVQRSIQSLKKILNFEFKYYGSGKNIGLGKASNFLFDKVKSKYCLFTQPDVKIKHASIIRLKKILEKHKKAICISPTNFKKKKSKSYEVKDKIDFSCIMIDVKKMKKIGFFDEDYFLYWEDIDLINRIKQSKYYMLQANNVNFEHHSSSSSEDTDEIAMIRNKNYIYGEFLYDYKNNKLKIHKILRKIFQNIFLFFFNILIFRIKHSKINAAKLLGINKFIFFYLRKNFTK